MSRRQNNNFEPYDVTIDNTTNCNKLFCWGQNSYSELGLGDTEKRFSPNLVYTFNPPLNSLDRIIQIACGNEHSVLLTEFGSVYSCGYNESAQCGSSVSNVVTQFTIVPDVKNIASIACFNGCEHTIALSASGDVFSFGYNARGQCGRAAVQKCDPGLVEGFTEDLVTMAGCSYFHTIVATEEGELYGFGRNDFGQLGCPDRVDKGVPTRIEALRGRKVLSIACGQYHTVISMAYGGVYAFGKNDYGQLGMEAHDMHAVPTLVASPLDEEIVTQVACGYYHTMARTEGGGVYSFGRNDYGQLGLGHKVNEWRPTRIPYFANMMIEKIACGCYHTLALSDKGIIYPFGRNNHGQLGLGNEVDTCVPQVIESLSMKKDEKVTTIGAGFYHSFCIVDQVDRISCTPRVDPVGADLAKLLNNAARSDVTFLVQGQEIFAHRCILMARCAPLEVMLNGPMRESHQNTIELPDHNHNVFLAMLEYIYTGNVAALSHLDQQDYAFGLELYSLADQYLLDALKSKCLQALRKSIHVETVSDLFAAADASNVTDLRKRCFNYIMVHFGSVIAQPNFSNLPPHLLTEVLTNAASRGVSIKN